MNEANIQELFKPFPKQLEFIESVLSGKYVFVMFGGSIRSGKSYAAIALLVMLCKIYPGSRYAIVRKDVPTLEKNVFPVIDKLMPASFIEKDARRSTNNPRIEFNNGSVIMFFGENYSRDKELNRFKGLEVNGWLADEINELQEESFHKMIERAGSYIIPNMKKQPKPLIFATVNPSPNWVKKLIYEPYIENKLKKEWHFIPAKISDNPYLPNEYLESLKTLPAYHYKIYVEGSWNFNFKVQNAYWRSFDLDRHLGNHTHNPGIPIHISIDSNVLPYISIQLWQMPNEYTVFQIGEITAVDPNNSAQKSAQMLCEYLNDLCHNDLLILHGDSSAKAKNTIDPEKRSFITLFEGELKEQFIVKNKVARSNPSVSLRGEFINAIYEGLIKNEDGNKLSISIDESCKTSINDYITVVQDMNGGMLKKKITKDGLTYEPNGHLSDCKAYFLCDVFKKEFYDFKNAGSTHNYILNVVKSHNEM